MDVTEREARGRDAERLLDGLAGLGVVGVATTFVDNSGIARVKAFPLARLPHVAAWGVGISTSFDRFRADDWIAGDGHGAEPVGDLRIIPDVSRVVALSGQPGWAWAPGERYHQSGEPHDQCGRLLLGRLTEGLPIGVSTSGPPSRSSGSSRRRQTMHSSPPSEGPAMGWPG